MSEENAGENAPAGDTISAAPQPPEWLGGDTKFWDGEKGEVRAEDIHKSYREVQSLIGRRVGDLSADARRKLAESLPDEMRATWDAETRAKLLEDPEFIDPLKARWAEENKPSGAPESYAPPEGLDLDTDSPLLGEFGELARKFNLPQEQYAELVAFGVRMLDPYTSGLDEEGLKKALGADLPDRAKIVTNRVKSLAGEHADIFLSELKSPSSFLAVEALLKANATKPLALEPGAAPSAVTEAELKQMMADPRYCDPYKRDPTFEAKVNEGWRKLYGDTIRA